VTTKLESYSNNQQYATV